MRFVFSSTLLSLAFTLLFTWTAYAETSQEVTLTVLETSDVHGRLTNYDYATGHEDKCGLVKCATIIKQEREKDPHLLLVDCGDTSQGNLVNEFRHDPMPPVAKVFNAMGYDIWTLGNHDFNFDFPALQSIIKNFKGDVLAGNIYKQDGTRFAKPYVIKNIKGVKVAIIGVDAPHIPVWESDPSHYDNMTFTTPMVEIGKILEEIKPLNPDVTIVMAHYGESGEKGEKGMYEVGKAYGNAVDAYLIGHAHSTLLKYYNGRSWDDKPTAAVQTCLMETGCNAQNVGKLTLTLQQNGQGGWTLKDRNLELLSCAEAAPDPEVSAVLQDLHERSLAAADRVICKVTRDFVDEPLLFPYTPKAVLAPSAITNLITTVMLQASGADVAMTTLYSADANVKAGDFRFKDACKIYLYENSLFGVRVTGSQLKRIMEMHAGRFFNTPVAGDVTLSFSDKMRLYEYDIFKGVNYDIDVSQPLGHRIKNITYKGKPLTAEQELVLAVCDFRFGQLVHEGSILAEDLVFNSEDLAENTKIRDMIVQYLTEAKVYEPTVDPNWKIVGYTFDDPQKELIYDMIRAGKIKIPVSNSGRNFNYKAINANELRAQGILPALSK